MLHAKMAIWTPDKHTAWSIHNAKYKTHPEGDKICSPAFLSSIYIRTCDL